MVVYYRWFFQSGQHAIRGNRDESPLEIILFAGFIRGSDLRAKDILAAFKGVPSDEDESEVGLLDRLSTVSKARPFICSQDLVKEIVNSLVGRRIRSCGVRIGPELDFH